MNCKIIGCDSVALARGLCQKHYDYKRNHVKGFIKHPHHGMSFSPEYYTWVSMISRCENKNTKDYKRYGGGGIKVCKRWKTFVNFYADVGTRSEGTTLDRIDNNGNYEPDNVRWATHAENSQNTCANKLNWELIRKIREEYSTMETSQGKLGRKYNISQAFIGKIVNRLAWIE